MLEVMANSMIRLIGEEFLHGYITYTDHGGKDEVKCVGHPKQLHCRTNSAKRTFDYLIETNKEFYDRFDADDFHSVCQKKILERHKGNEH